MCRTAVRGRSLERAPRRTSLGVDGPTQADDLVHQGRGSRPLAPSLVEDHDSREHARQLWRQPELRAVVVQREDLRRERVEIGQQQGGERVLA